LADIDVDLLLKREKITRTGKKRKIVTA